MSVTSQKEPGMHPETAESPIRDDQRRMLVLAEMRSGAQIFILNPDRVRWEPRTAEGSGVRQGQNQT